MYMFKLTATLSCAALLLAVAWSHTPLPTTEARGSAQAAFVVQLLGSATARGLTDEEIDILGLTDQTVIDGTACFDLDLVDPETGSVIGHATDCLIVVSSVGSGLFIEAATFFYLPEGLLVVEGRTTVQPTTGGSTPATHITGSIPTPGSDSVLHGTKRFRDATGEARLSGAVNLSKLQSDSEITFDCVFVVDLD
jgi:hypothetical protein